MKNTFWGSLLCALVFGVLPGTGCNKTDDFEDLDLLIQKEWKLTSITKENVEISEPCDLDDILRFDDASTFSYDFGLMQCSEEAALQRTATRWKIIDHFTTLRLKFDLSGSNIGSGEAIEYWKIITLTETMLVVEDALAEDNSQIPEIRTYVN